MGFIGFDHLTKEVHISVNFLNCWRVYFLSKSGWWIKYLPHFLAALLMTSGEKPICLASSSGEYVSWTGTSAKKHLNYSFRLKQDLFLHSLNYNLKQKYNIHQLNQLPNEIFKLLIIYSGRFLISCEYLNPWFNRFASSRN